MNNFNGFTLQAVGTLARNPEVVTKGNVAFVRFCLVGNNYSTEDNGEERPVASTIWFHAFDVVADRLIKHGRKGDQLIVEALVHGIAVAKDGHTTQQVNFLVTAFEFGAKACKGGNASSTQAASPPRLPPDGAVAAASGVRQQGQH